MSQDSGADGPALGTRWPELGLAAFLFALSAMVIADSLRVGTGWADDGPRSGYFPFYIGLFLAASSGWIIVKQLLRWRAADPEFAQHSQLRLVLSVLVPMVLYVGAIALLGIYVASALLIAWFMLKHGRYKALPTVAVSLGVPLFFYLVFERWFLVLLPKGPLERLLGL
jgi:putative tricarboxylic transport membrane protein